MALLALSLLSLVQLAEASDPQSATVYVEIAEAKVRKEAKHWAAGVETLPYGTPLTVLEGNDGWFKVRTSTGAVGFIHQSAISTRKIILARGSGNIQLKADESDVVLAGKGFNDDIEVDYKDSHKDLPFDKVDKLSKANVAEEKIGSFIAAGKLKE